MGGFYRYQPQPSGNQSSPVRMSWQGCGHWGHRNRNKRGLVAAPSHQWLLLPSVLTGSERCLVASAPYQTLAVAVLPGICFPGNAAVQTCVLGDPPAGIFFFSIYLFCAYSQGFELFVRSVFKADEGPKQPSSPCLWF